MSCIFPVTWLLKALSDGNISEHSYDTKLKIHLHGLSACLYTTHAIARYFLPIIFWVLAIRISNKVGKESTLFCVDSFKSHSTLNISHAKQFNYWSSPGNQQPLLFILRVLPNVIRQKPPQEMVVSGCSVAVRRSVNSLPGCVYTGHSNRKDPKTHGNH